MDIIGSQFVKAMITGLLALKKINLMHFDAKPGNMLFRVDKSNRDAWTLHWVLIDFGFVEEMYDDEGFELVYHSMGTWGFQDPRHDWDR